MIILKLFFAFQIFSTVFCKRPNIVVIVADDLGWGDVSFHGSKQIATPNIDALASDGIILNNFYVSAICTPTRGALLTARHPIQLGLQNGVIQAGQPFGLPLSVSTLPQWLRELNYSTVGVGKWHLGFHKKAHIPTERGFDSFFGYWNAHSDYYNRITHSSVVPNNTGRGIDFHRDAQQENVTKYKDIYSTELYTQKAVNAMVNHTKNGKDKSLFLYLAHQAVHGANGYDPLQAPEKYKNRFGHIKDKRRRTFAGMVSALDDSIGKLMQGMEKAGILNNTIIVFTTDNGGAVGKGDGVRSNMPIRGSKGSLWEGGVRATAFMWSKLLPKKYVSEQLMHVTDIPTTLYRAAGGDVHDLGTIEGKNLWEALRNNLPSPRKHLLHNIHVKWAVRSGDYKLITVEGPSNQMFIPKGYNDSVFYRNTTNWSPDPEKSPVAQVLLRLNRRAIKPVKVVVDCGRQEKVNKCKAGNKICLFDVKKDPCEFNDISSEKPDIVKQLTELMRKYNATAIPPGNKPLDYRSLPVYHNGRWSVWLD